MPSLTVTTADALKPGLERNITGDVSIIKPDRQNYTDEEMKAFAKKIGAKLEDVQEFIEGEDGVYVPAEEDDDSLSPDPSPVREGSAVPTNEPDTYDPFNQ